MELRFWPATCTREWANSFLERSALRPGPCVIDRGTGLAANWVDTHLRSRRPVDDFGKTVVRLW